MPRAVFRGQIGGASTAAETRRLQMADVARLAGVSISTVSRALNGSELVSASTRQRICDLAQSLHYSIDAGAQNLRLRQNRTVAVVLPFDSRARRFVADPFAESMLCALAVELHEKGYNMLLARVDAGQIQTIAQLHGTGQAVGILMLGRWQHHAQLNELAARGDPIIVWGAQMPQQLYCSVGSDNTSGGREATRHLLAGGCRHVAFLGDVADLQNAQRFEGHCQALAESGKTVTLGLHASVTNHFDDVRAALQDLLLRKAVDGIFAANDGLAMAAISALRTLDMRIPEDIAVVGFDDNEMAAYFHPSLTTVRQPVGAAVRELVRTLTAQIAGQRPPPVLLPTQLIIRASSVRRGRRGARKIEPVVR